MKVLFLLLLCCITTVTMGQTNRSTADTGATANLATYNVLYILNQADDKKIRGIIRNINNALDDSRLKGKLHVELVVFGEGVEIFKKLNHYDTLLVALQFKGVLLAQCLNTMKERKISKDELWPFITYVPSGNGEIIIRHYQGWATVHP